MKTLTTKAQRPGKALSLDQTIVKLAREIAANEHLRRGLLRELRAANETLRVRRRELKRLVGTLTDRPPVTPPLYQFGDSTSTGQG